MNQQTVYNLKRVFTKRPKTTQGVLYFFLGLAALVGALYLFFPSEQVKRLTVFRLNEQLPEGLSVHVGRVVPRFPPGVALNAVELRRQERTIAEIPNVILKPDLPMLFKGGQGVRFQGQAFSGRFRGRLRYSRGSKEEMVLRFGFGGVDLGGISGLSDRMSGVNFQGNANGQILYRSRGQAKASGKGGITVKEGAVVLAKPLRGIKRVALEPLQASFVIDGTKLTIKEVRIQGKRLRGRGGGHVRLAQPLAYSRVNFTLHVQARTERQPGQGKGQPRSEFMAQAASENGVSLRVTGPLFSPMVH